ncbi:MAG: carbohydrate ABC transporter permease, partial [Bacilli bacterium]|nr:carbohydrate ABC transporter permease [Bacilli bacterium]
SVNLIPTKLYFQNFVKAFKTIGFFKALGQSVLYALVPTLLQVASTSLVGYGLAKFKFKGKKAVFGLIIASFIIPSQILMIPTYVTYSKLGLLGSILTFALPATFAQGLKNAIFILLFYEFFIMLPVELDEAAMLDGAGRFKIFFRVAIPLSSTIFIVAFIFSFVWYWNETYLTSLYIANSSTLPMQLSRFAESYRSVYASAGQSSSYTDKLNDTVYMAGTLISILPLLLLYFVLQKWFVQGIDKTGLGGM